MNPVSDKKYTGDGSNEKIICIKDARIGSRNLLNDPMKQLANGIAQYEYLESWGPRMGGQARRLLDNFIDKWDYRDETNPFYEEAVTREASRAKWRHYYKAKSVYDLRQIQVQTGGPISYNLICWMIQSRNQPNWTSSSLLFRRHFRPHWLSTWKTCMRLKLNHGNHSYNWLTALMKWQYHYSRRD